MKFNIKSKFGFTLIELLVVIGILAVLAAIAIPSVAGLIDRANVSADATNANEMTNAVERFVSEYELYVQDISSGRLDTENLDAAQGRVKNVTNVIDRAGIETLEKDATAGVNTTGRAIYRDTKYPVNAETMQAVVENYMKTSSTTFTPKQSDCHFYYSPDCGVVVCTEINKSSVTDLNNLIQSKKDAKGNDLDGDTKWIDLTADISVDGAVINENTNPLIHTNIIPEGGIYKHIEGYIECCANCYENHGVIKTDIYYNPDFDDEPECAECYYPWDTTSVPDYVTYTAGDTFPTLTLGDYYLYGGVEYAYGDYFCCDGYWTIECDACSSDFTDYNNGWDILIRQDSTVEILLQNINGLNVVCFDGIGGNSFQINSTLLIPETITTLHYFFDLANNGTIEINHYVSPIGLEYANFQTQKLNLTGTSSLLDNIASRNDTYCVECKGYCELGHPLG